MAITLEGVNMWTPHIKGICWDATTMNPNIWCPWRILAKHFQKYQIPFKHGYWSSGVSDKHLHHIFNDHFRILNWSYCTYRKWSRYTWDHGVVRPHSVCNKTLVISFDVSLWLCCSLVLSYHAPLANSVPSAPSCPTRRCWVIKFSFTSAAGCRRPEAAGSCWNGNGVVLRTLPTHRCHDLRCSECGISQLILQRTGANLEMLLPLKTPKYDWYMELPPLTHTLW